MTELANSPARRWATEPPACRLVTARSAAVEQLVLDHLGLADALARTYGVAGGDAEDLRQVARLGLLLAAQRYREDAGGGFLQFAVPTIRGTLQRHLRDHCWAVRPPRGAQQHRRRVLRAREALLRELNREPTAAEVQAKAGVSPNEWAAATLADAAVRAAPLDAITMPGDPAHRRPEAVSEAGYDDVERRLMVRVALRDASERDLQLLRMRFVDQLTQAQIAGELGVSQMQVSRQLSRLLTRLRGQLGAASSAAPEWAGDRSA